MKTLLLLAFPLCLLSCSKVQYFTISSTEGIKNKDRELVFENDTIKIVYRFNGFLAMTIFNKSSSPLEINWKKSAFVSGNEAVAYYTPDLKIEGKMRAENSKSFVIPGVSTTSAKIEGKATGNSESQFLPPQSNITRYFKVLPNRKVENLSFDHATKERLKTPSNLNFKFRKLSFDQVSSPFRFRNFLTINSGSAREFYVDHSFYASEAWLSGQSPSLLPRDLQDNGDMFSL